MRNGVDLSEKGKNEIVIYQPNDAIRLDVRLENETVWLNRHQMAQLFGRDVKTIGKHIANALPEELTQQGVVDETTASCVSTDAVVAKFATTATDGKVYQVEYYSLDVILSVGYRVKSTQGILFRRWANMVLKDYLLRGYSINSRLNQLEDKMDRRLARHDGEIADLKEKVDFFVQTKEPPLRRNRSRPSGFNPQGDNGMSRIWRGKERHTEMKPQDMKANEKYGIFSFFTGAGFLDLGFEDAGVCDCAGAHIIV